MNIRYRVDLTAEERMEDVLDLYNEEPDPKRPVVCFDESPTQIIGEARLPIPARPGQLERFDCEYRRNGTANLFVFLDAHRSWRRVKVTDRRAAQDFAGCMRDLVDVHFPNAEKIRLVLDNLSTHSAGALYQTFRRRRRGAFCAASSSTTPQGTQAGSTWWRSRSASCATSASIAASTAEDCSSPKSPPGNSSETAPAHPSIGCSPQKKPAPKWPAPIRPQSISHNLCAEVLTPWTAEEEARTAVSQPSRITASRCRSSRASPSAFERGQRRPMALASMFEP